MIKIKNIEKSFDGRVVLDDITANFYPGKANFVIGASGSGKSVLMKCMVGLVDVDQGEIYYSKDDFVHKTYEERKVIRKEIGMLFQGTNGWR